MKHLGLSEKQIPKLKEEFGNNVLPEKEAGSSFLLFLSQFNNPLIYILFFVLAISLFFKEYLDASLIGLVVAANSILGFIQEYKAQRTLQALRKIIKPKTTVIRDGKQKTIEAKDLVPGDIVVLDHGERVPADGKLLEGIDVLINEALLTGEEEPVEKNMAPPQNEIFMGTLVLSGRGIMQVSKIGTKTKMGEIGLSLSEIQEEKTPLQKKLAGFTKNLAVIIVFIALCIFALGLVLGQNVLEMFRFSTVLAVAAIPEGLPIAITVILVLGMKRILKRNGLVKRMISIETLGSTSIICTDKTGTLTEGNMRVVKTDFADQRQGLIAISLLNNLKSGLEIALWEYARKQNPANISEFQKIYEEPFDSEKKYSFLIAKKDEVDYAFVMGAGEIVLDMCQLDNQQKEDLTKKLESWAEEGLKILAVGYKKDGELKEKNGFTFLGLIGIQDPIRKEAAEAIRIAQEAGIKIKIVTGDYRKTAERVAKNLGFDIKPEQILEGRELEVLPDHQLKNMIDGIILFARITPHQKLKIVRVLQEKGEVVAMTGDGVNDAPALKKADIGVAVDNASDVSKEASDLILLDNNLQTIVSACEEGRLIFSNIRKVVAYVLSNSFVEMVMIAGSIFLGLPFPLTLVQILWVHLITDGPIDILLGFEPKDSSLMKKKPAEIIQEGILPASMKFLIFAISFTIGIISLLFFWYFLKKTGDIILAQTIAFATIATVDIIYIFSFKNLEKNIFRTPNFFQNWYLLLGVIYSAALLVIAIYVPFFNRILGTKPLVASYWLLILSVAVISIIWVELAKFIKNKART